jgi:membrane associated rhomboid family serine protease
LVLNGMSSRIRSLAQRAPLSVAFCCLSLVALAVSIAMPASVRHLALFPEDVIVRGHVWALLTYAILHGSILHLLVVSVPVLWLGWYLEPVFGWARYLVLLVGGALGAGIAYVFSQPGLPLVGGLFVANAVVAAFTFWSIPNRGKFSSRLRVFWALVVIWAAYTLWASPLEFSAVHMVSWGIGVVVALSWVHRKPPMPNNTMEPTR